MQRFIDDVINAQDLDGDLVELVAENFVELSPLPGQVVGFSTATIEAWTIDRFRNGISVESRIIMDVAGLLGVLPASEAA